MKRLNTLIFSTITAGILIGCGGGGGSAGTSSGVTPTATVQKYDLYNYFIL